MIGLGTNKLEVWAGWSNRRKITSTRKSPNWDYMNKSALLQANEGNNFDFQTKTTFFFLKKNPLARF